MDRPALIARKHEVQAAIRSTIRARDQLRRVAEPSRAERRHLARLERRIDQLAAEESRLRAAIDRTPAF